MDSDAGVRLVTVRSVAAVAFRPDLWSTAIRVGLLLARPGWWRRPPRLPLPDPAYLRFRMITVYGGEGSGPARPEDLIAYLEWLRSWSRVTGRRR